MIVYFRTHAKENGCPEAVLNGGDLGVWKFLVALRRDELIKTHEKEIAEIDRFMEK